MDVKTRLDALVSFIKKTKDEEILANLEHYLVENLDYKLPVSRSIPLVPTQLRAWWKGNNDTGIDWVNSKDAKGYIVDFSSDGGKTWEQVGNLVGDGRYIRHNPSPFGLNQYRIKAYNDFGESDYSPAITFEMSKDNKSSSVVEDLLKGYTKVAKEGEIYDFGKKVVDVAYGVENKFYFKKGLTGKVAFNNDFFGDPFIGLEKHGYYKISNVIPSNPGSVIVSNFVGETEVPFFIKADEIQKEDSKIPSRTDWLVIGPDGKVVLETEGFNISFLPTMVGNYKIKVSNKTASREYILEVKEKKWDIITDPVDLSAAIRSSTSSTKIILTKESTLTTSEKFSGRLLGNGNRINYTGPTFTAYGDGGWPMSVFQLLKGASLDGIKFAGSFYDPTQRHKAVKFCDVSGNNYISNCELSRISFGVNLEGRPSNIGWVANRLDRYLTNYMVWLGGSGIFVYGNTAEDSSTEHIVRGDNYEWVTVARNKLRNMDLRKSNENKESWNFSKSCINMQRGKLCYVYDNEIIDGSLSVGPLNGGDGDKTGIQWVYYCVVRNNKGNGTAMNNFEVHHGIEYLLVEGNIGASTTLFPFDEAYPIEHTIKNSDIAIKKDFGWRCWPIGTEKYLLDSVKIREE